MSESPGPLSFEKIILEAGYTKKSQIDFFYIKESENVFHRINISTSEGKLEMYGRYLGCRDGFTVYDTGWIKPSFQELQMLINLFLTNHNNYNR